MTTLRPGWLVGLKTRVRGNVTYEKVTLEPGRVTRSGAHKQKWETERTIRDPDEFMKACKVRMRTRTIIASVCAKSDFGYLCPDANLEKLEVAVREAQRLADEFNGTASFTRVSVSVLRGRIERDDARAVRSIKGEVAEILSMMADGVKNCDAKSIREAASRGRNLGSMLPPDVAAQVKDIITKVRTTARKIVKAGENAAIEVDNATIEAITAARTAFLDLGDDNEAPEAPEAPAEGRTVELEESGAELEGEAAPARQVELDDEAPQEPATGRFRAANPDDSSPPKAGANKKSARKARSQRRQPEEAEA